MNEWTGKRSRSTTEINEIIEIGRQILSVFYFLGRITAVHFDVKPENIMIRGREAGK